MKVTVVFPAGRSASSCLAQSGDASMYLPHTHTHTHKLTYVENIGLLIEQVDHYITYSSFLPLLSGHLWSAPSSVL